MKNFHRPAALVRLFLPVLIASGVAKPAAGQIAPDQYLKYVPIDYPALVRQTAAIQRLTLFGDAADPAYRDVDPVDGIDDARARWLRQLAVRFAPLVRNTPMFPMDFRSLYSRKDFGSHVDTWDLARHAESFVERSTILTAELGASSCGAGSTAASADCRLIEVIKKFGGARPPLDSEGTTGAERSLFSVLYFDMPGWGEKTWQAEYWAKDGKSRSPSLAGSERVFVHPLIA